MRELSRAQRALMIACLVLIWGLSWPIYKMALHDTPPMLFAGLRCLLGGLLLILLALPKYKIIRWKQAWHIYVISALLNAFLFFALQTVGLQYMPSGLFSVIVYLQPVLVGVLAWLWLGERMTVLKIVGLLLGFVGVACISTESLSGQISWVGILFALGSGASWALGTVYAKKVAGAVDGVWLAAIQFTIGGLFMTGYGSLVERWANIGWGHLPYLMGLLYGAVFGVAVAWLLYFTLVRSGEASRVASFTFIVPLVAVLTGTVFLHEPFTLNLLAGIVLIVVSIYLVNRPAKAAHRPNQQSIEVLRR
jgi:drug/metabolite transporter (DMT)-like permease